METKYHLKIQSGPQIGSDYALEKPELFLGRDPNNDLVIPDPEVSRRHARLLLSGTEYSIEDLGSTNGTFVQGIQIHSQTPLNSGDIISIGERVVLLYEVTVFDPDATMVVPRQAAAAPEIRTGEVVPPFIEPVQPVVVPIQGIADAIPASEPQAEPVAQVKPPPEPVTPKPTAPPEEKEVYLEPATSMAGKVPAQPPAAKKRGAWKGIILIIVLLILIFCVIPWIIIDITNSYCLFLPGILNAIQPGVCP